MEGGGESQQPQETPQGGGAGEGTAKTRLQGWEILPVSFLAPPSSLSSWNSTALCLTELVKTQILSSSQKKNWFLVIGNQSQAGIGDVLPLWECFMCRYLEIFASLRTAESL